MEKGYKSILGKINRETSGHIRQKVIKCDASDVNGITYFADNVDISTKRIEFYDINNDLLKVTIFTYGGVLSDNMAVKNIYNIYDDSNFTGIWVSSSVPVTGYIGEWKFVDTNVTINGTVYTEGDIIGYIEINFVKAWRKCKFDGNGKLIAK
jgi:hypothetical protein